MTADQFTDTYMEWRNAEIDRGVKPELLTMAHFGAEICTVQDETLERIRIWLHNAAQESPLIHKPNMAVPIKVN